jgi:glycosyltransferase involved in cell wall biosynthesis
MKVLVLAPPMGATGGIQRYTATLVLALGDILGDKGVRMLAVSGEPESRRDAPAALRPSVKLRFLLAAVTMAVRWRPQLVLCMHIGVAPAARIIQRLTGTPYWVTLHGIEVWGELSPSKLRALRGTQRLLANSRFTLEAARSRHALGEPSTSLLAPAFSGIQPSKETPLAQGHVDSQQAVVLTVGRLAASERYKGHDVMLDAWPIVLRQIPNAQYIIVGDGNDRPRLEARTRDMGLTGSVFFKGVVSGNELQACYDSCRVFALPARTVLDAHSPQGEGFGIVFLEAMAHGKPVVGPNAGAPAEFIRSGEHGLLVDPVKPEEVAGALIELLQHPDRARQMGHAAREWVQEQFSYEMFCRRLREILREQSLIHGTGA